MGPTNVALVKLFQAEQSLREAQSRLDAVTKGVRIQDRKVRDLNEKLQVAQARLKEQQTQSASLDLDLKSREAHIEKLRQQQQTAKTNKEYQTFLVEINTEKVDRSKIEEQVLKAMGDVEKSQAEVKELSVVLETETNKLQEMQTLIGDRQATLQAEINLLVPVRQSAADAISPSVRNVFDKLCERFDGEAMSALAKPHVKREEYICTACNMSLVTDVYNRLHVRDEPVFCPSCRRFLYIPDELPPEMAVNKQKKPREEKPAVEKPTEAKAAEEKSAEVTATDAPPAV